MRAVIALLFVAACAPSDRPAGDDDDDTFDPVDAAVPGVDAYHPPPCGEACENHCPDGTATYLEGVVLAPNGIDPVPGAAVYVPIGEPPAFPDGIACELCNSAVAGAIVQTRTAPDGSFRLGPLPTAENPPAGGSVSVVAQKGRFRRRASVPIATWCGDNSGDITLPGRREDAVNTIPKIAVVSGQFDAMECVLTKLGIQADAIKLYNGLPIDGGDAIFNDPAVLGSYNIVFFDCGANELALLDAAVKQRLTDYVNAGGRVYVTDQAYDFVEQLWPASIDFGPDMSSGTSSEAANAAQIGAGGITTEGLVHDPAMATWLEAVEARTGDELISDQMRVHIEHFLGGWAMQFATAGKAWISGQVSGQGLSGDLPLTSTFDVNQCGRVLYSSYHTLGNDSGGLLPFPLYCPAGDLSPQERILEFLILHAADCIVIE